MCAFLPPGEFFKVSSVALLEKLEVEKCINIDDCLDCWLAHSKARAAAYMYVQTKLRQLRISCLRTSIRKIQFCLTSSGDKCAQYVLARDCSKNVSSSLFHWAAASFMVIIDASFPTSYYAFLGIEASVLQASRLKKRYLGLPMFLFLSSPPFFFPKDGDHEYWDRILENT